ncbi:MAG: CDGSH iron-sulfur domain-containing protein [Pseudonocardiales bacterium]|nr:CDGSH iron-sulfur domain-containing protein [Pseudonocardiales bacterium]MBV9729492.1 CDGSH iron-sulfur domain-containing protein [Pseudonocardiales bacterium]
MSEQTTGVTSAKATSDARGPLVRACAAEYAGSLLAGYAACTLKNDVYEGLSPDQAARARAWKRAMLFVAADHVRRIAQITNIGIALGAFEEMTPGPVSAAAAAAGLQLRPFTVSALPNTDARSVPIDLSSIIADLRRRPPAEWRTAGQLDAAIFDTDATGTGMPVVVDGPEALESALQLLAEPLAVPSEPGVPLPEGPWEPTRPNEPANGAPDHLTTPISDLVIAVYRTTLVLADRALIDGSGPDPDQTEQETRQARIAVVLRLLASVLRPLAEVLARRGAATPEAAVTHDDIDPLRERPSADLLLALADQATALAAPDVPSELLEAVAALQELAVRTAPPAGGPDLPARWWAPIGGADPVIRSATNGPYLGLGVRDIVDHLGVPVPTRPVMALCRCGRSSLKPLCDGSHARVEFTGAKDPRRVPDRRDRSDGLQVTVLDNRGTCAHSGFCTTRLPVVFRQGKEPFVASSGGRMDEIIRAVRDCPSGALSYEIEGREARDQVDWRREPGIEVSKDGPYRVTGGIELRGDDGNDEHRNEGASREHYSLCRCGQSQNKPFCSGMHWYVNFADPVPDPDEVPTVFEWVGGLPALRRLTRLFYEKYIPEDPLLAPVFAEMSTDHPERVAKWLSEVFGGPKYFTDQYGGYPRMISQHIGKGLTETLRSRWASLMVQAANDAELPSDAEFRAAFVSYIEWGSRIAVENSQYGAVPPPNMPVPRWWWACNATPRARVSALAPKQVQAPVVLPEPDEDVSFAAHIKPLFRAMDRNSMKFVFDLWAIDDVTAHADAILRRLREGTMPCDGAWPIERIEVFQRWVTTGMAP